MDTFNSTWRPRLMSKNGADTGIRDVLIQGFGMSCCAHPSFSSRKKKGIALSGSCPRFPLGESCDPVVQAREDPESWPVFMG